MDQRKKRETDKQGDRETGEEEKTGIEKERQEKEKETERMLGTLVPAKGKKLVMVKWLKKREKNLKQ